ncbi:MAG TPA: diacylglycerol kinase family protein [Thermoanaerobaculia bacterium]|jgi:diacylglycerol kinase (ATP)|nr:diacylglycerol kinase family protein [Thermoanaerobaculia bacterium]
MKVSIIVNPNAGSVQEVAQLRETLGRLPEASVHLTKKEGDAREIARAAVQSGAGLVVAAGGDGTLNEVLNGLSEDFGHARLGLLPLGTGNDFARSINVPADLEGALAVLETGRVQKIDVARATLGDRSRYFVNMSAGGFSGVVSEKASEVKDRWGPLAYLRAALGTLPALKGFETRILVNGVESLTLDTYNIVVSNGRFVAAGIPVAPQSRLDDGLLDVMIAPATTIPQLAILVPQVLLGRHTESDLLLFRKVTRIEIESDPPMSFNVDGELIGDAPAYFEVLPRALEVVVGPEEEAG